MVWAAARRSIGERGSESILGGGHSRCAGARAAEAGCPEARRYNGGRSPGTRRLCDAKKVRGNARAAGSCERCLRPVIEPAIDT